MSEELKNVSNADTSTDDVNNPNQNESTEGKDSHDNPLTGLSVEKIADLKAQIQNLTVEKAKLKRAMDKLASENGDLTKKYREKLSEEERRSLEIAEAEVKRQEEFEALNEKVKAYEREKNLANAVNSYISLGWTNDEASRMATAELDGNFEEKMKIMAEVNERQKKAYDVEALRNRPPVNNGGGVPLKGDISKMTYSEMCEFLAQNPGATI